MNFNECEDDSTKSSIIGKIVHEPSNSIDLNKYSESIDFKSKLESCLKNEVE
jgi:hypothetical protein